MKLVLVAALSLILGFVLGGIGPRTDLRRTTRALKEAKQRASEGGASAAVPMALGGLFAARDRAADRAVMAPHLRRPEAPLGVPAGDSQDDEGHGATGADTPDAGANADGGTRDRKGLRALADDETFGTIKSAADLRAAQFRAAFLEEAGLGADATSSLDDVIDKMNEDFAREADEIAALIDDKGDKITPRDMADIGVKLLDVYRGADDAMKGGLPPGAMDAADRTRFDLLTQVDVAAFRKLAEAAAKMERPPERLR